MSKIAIICDLDGTLCDASHRLHYIRSPHRKKEWNKFFNACDGDAQNDWCRDIISCFKHMYQTNILIVTGRPESSRRKTEEWLDSHGIEFDFLFMRKSDDFRSDDIVKKEIYDAHIKNDYRVYFVIEDRQRVVDMWRAEGLTCLQCAPGDF